MYKAKLAILGLAAVGAALAAGTAPARAGFYDGKSITVLIGYGPGSGVTLTARNFAKFWKPNIPGKPNLIIKNMPGGGALKAQNFFYEKARRDGLTLIWGPTAWVGRLIGAPGVRAKYEEFEVIGSFKNEYISYTRKDLRPGLRLTKAADLLKSKTPIVIGCTRPSSNLCILHRLGFEILGVPHRLVAGFRSTPKTMRAIMQSEVDTHTTPGRTYRAVVEPAFKKDDRGLGLYYYPLLDKAGNPLKNPDFPDLPSFTDVYKEIHGGKMPSGVRWQAMQMINNVISQFNSAAYAPPGTPKEALAVLRASFRKTLTSKGYPEFHRKAMMVGLKPTALDDHRKFLATFLKSNPKLVALLKKYGTRKARKGGKKGGKKRKK